MEVGFPDKNSTGVKTSFDKEATIFLASYPALKTGEALRDDVWACLSFIFLPDLVRWRFEGYPRDRYLGGVRNTFQRLWARGVVLDRGEGSNGRWQLVDQLTEDAMVQIFERSSVSGNPELARIIGESWLKTRELVPAGEMESLMRQAMKIIRLRNEIYAYPMISSEMLLEEVLKVFSQVARDMDVKERAFPAQSSPLLEPGEASPESRGKSIFDKLKKYLPRGGKQ